MNKKAPRPRRWLRLLGLLILVGSVGGAAWVLQPLVLNAGAVPAKAALPISSSGWFCGIGHVDVRDGVIDINPELPGRVEEIAAEGSIVAEGGKLLVLNSERQELEVNLAKEEVTRATHLLEKARRLPIEHQAQIDEAEKAVAVVGKAIEVAEAEYQRAWNNYKDVTNAEVIRNKARVTVAKLEKEKAEAAVATLKKKVPGDEVRIAESNLTLAQKKQELAELGLSKCRVLASMKVKVLRALVRQGEIVPHPQHPVALQVCPADDLPSKDSFGKLIVRGEVEQEWAWKVEKGQKVEILDDVIGGNSWVGVIDLVDDWQGQRQHPIQQPFQNQDVRRLGFLVRITGPGMQARPDAHLRIGQRTRLKIFEQVLAKSNVEQKVQAE